MTALGGIIDFAPLALRRPTFDVVVPCYNYAHYLRACVRSALDQPDVDVRVLIIDDCSTDKSQEVGQQLAAEDPRIEYRRHAVNQKHIATYNEGLTGWATADYSVLLSADDMLVPGAMRRAAAIMHARADVGMVYGSAVFFTDEAPANLETETSSEHFQIIESSRFLEFCCTTGNPVPTPAAIVRTEVQQKLGGYLPSLPHTGDMEMWMRFATHGPIGVVRATQALYRWHGGNMSRGYYGRPLKDRRERINACETLFKTHGVKFEKASFWLRDQKRRLSNEALWWAAAALEEGDLDGMRECIEFASEHHPGVLTSPPWWRLTAKRLVGPALLKRLQPFWNRVRGVAGDKTGQQLQSMDGIRPGTRTGWWPGTA